MQADLLIPAIFVGFIMIVPVVLLALAIRQLRKRSSLSRGKLIGWTSLGVISLLPLLGIGYLLLSFAVSNFPFTSGVIAQASSPNGEEACVVQTFKDVEPYQVSLYARQRGQPWVWHYLAHQDDRWRSCRIDFAGDELRVFTGSTLRKTFSIAEATAMPKDSNEQLPAEYTPGQILARHNAYFHH